MRYVIEMKRPTSCDCCDMADSEEFICHAETNLPIGHNCGKNLDGTRCDGIPDWCPLVSYEQMVASELVDSINSQPLSDEPKETIRIELYKSEIDKLGAMSIANGLSVAQMVAKLINECKVAKPYINHDDHGSDHA